MSKKYRLTVIISLVFVLSSFLFMPNANAVCKGTFFNPLTDIDWWGVFPIKIGGLKIVGSKISTPNENTGSPVCICGKPPNVEIGLKVSFWDPGRLAETVKDPWCSPTLGTGLGGAKGFLGGSSSEEQPEEVSTFAQTHWLWIDFFQLAGILVDAKCFEQISGFDFAGLTEIDPLWNDDVLAFIANPEALLFANPIAQLACSIDSVASSAGIPLNFMFWCLGSWGSAYPYTGHYNGRNIVKANAAIAAKFMFFMARTALLWDHASSYCNAMPLPILIKNHYRFQEARPWHSGFVFPLGRTPLIGWGAFANPPVTGGKGASDNFLWVIFEDHHCCFGIGL